MGCQTSQYSLSLYFCDLVYFLHGQFNFLYGQLEFLCGQFFTFDKINFYFSYGQLFTFYMVKLTFLHGQLFSYGQIFTVNFTLQTSD